MKIKEVPLSRIKPYLKNPRKNDAAVSTVARSIREFGFNSPIILDAENVIVAGHTRFKAAQILGMATVPCVYPELTPEQARKYRIADNKAGELAEWDMDLLLEEIREMEAADSLQPYFNDLDLAAELEKLGNPPEQIPVRQHSRTPGGKPVTCPACRHEFTPVKNNPSGK